MNSFDTNINVLNSFSRQKEPLIRTGDKLTWYGCGPTVYDSPHLGHARTYVSFDIIRRIMVDYFNLNVVYCMNITDIDDKIIRRARQQHLIVQYKQDSHSKAELLKDATSANNILGDKIAEETDPLKKEIFQSQYSTNRDHIEKFSQEFESSDEFLNNCEGVLSEYLDLKYGHTVNNNELFFALPRKYEDEFFNKMDILGVIRPNIVTRVTEFVPQIVDYIEKIISNGYAYSVPSGSVYFNVPHFSKHHSYPRLVPELAEDAKSLAEGEGSLITGEGEKRSIRDFALWKASKDGEPSWDSPWGKGRPGWHIECSVMATCAFGPQMDIHSGGCDLKFPHHDNEIAQAEAYFDGGCWVRYFLHSGHLTINGCKMSKSLKNFITIDAALQDVSPRRMRLLFLLHVWNQPFDYSPDVLNEALIFEKQLIEFLLTAKFYCRNGDTKESNDLESSLENTKKLFHDSLCDSFNTRQAMNEIKSLISSTNSFMNSNIASPSCTDMVKQISNFVIRSLKLFGLVESDNLDTFTVYKTSLSWETITDDLSPFLRIIEKTLTVFLNNSRKLDDIVTDIDSALEGSSAEAPILSLVETVKKLLKYIEQEVKELGTVSLSVQRNGNSSSVNISLENVSALKEKIGDFGNFESVAYDYVDFVSKVRDRYRYTCISLIKLLKQIRKSHSTSIVTPERLQELDGTLKILLGHSDVVRKELFDLGVKLEDFSGGTPAMIKFYDIELV